MDNRVNSMFIGDKEFIFKDNQVYVMGILNVTPDSFSDGAKYNTLDNALHRVGEMIEEGASIIDVGGESTRPGHVTISSEEEIERVAYIIENIKKEYDITVSIDTYKAAVAKEAFIAGADLLNDIWGLLYEDNGLIARYAKEYNASVCLMHNDNMNMNNNDMNIIIDRLNKSIDMAYRYGIDKDRIMIDPGIGFAKTYENNLYVMKNLDKLHVLNMPILLGTSNKSMIGIATEEEVENRVEGSIATTVYGMGKGIQFVRVHNVKEHVRAIKMTRAMMNIR